MLIGNERPQNSTKNTHFHVGMDYAVVLAQQSQADNGNTDCSKNSALSLLTSSDPEAQRERFSARWACIENRSWTRTVQARFLVSFAEKEATTPSVDRAKPCQSLLPSPFVLCR